MSLVDGLNWINCPRCGARVSDPPGCDCWPYPTPASVPARPQHVLHPDVLLNGGITLKLVAHVVCGHCTEFDDYLVRGPRVTTDQEKFLQDARAYFEKAGWDFPEGQKVRCPMCRRTKRKSKRKKA